MAITAYSVSNTPIGTSIYTFTGITAPRQYLPTLTAITAMNKSKTNTMYSIDVKYPLVAADPTTGVYVNRNTIQMSVRFTALRGVIADTEMTRCLDEAIAYLTSKKAKIIAGDVT